MKSRVVIGVFVLACASCLASVPEWVPDGARIGAGEETLAISPCGRRVAYVSSGALVVTDVDSGRTTRSRHRIDPRWKPIFDAAYDRVVFVTQESAQGIAVVALDLTNGYETPSIAARAPPVVSGDGEVALFVTLTGRLAALDLSTLGLRFFADRMVSRSYAQSDFFVMPGASQVAYARASSAPSDQDELHVLDVSTGHDRRIAPVATIDARGFRGSKLLFGGPDGVVKVLDAVADEEEAVTVLAHDPSPGFDLEQVASLSRDGARAVILRANEAVVAELELWTSPSHPGVRAVCSREEPPGSTPPGRPKPFTRIGGAMESAAISDDGCTITLRNAAGELFAYDGRSTRRLSAHGIEPEVVRAAGDRRSDFVIYLAYAPPLRWSGEAALHFFDVETGIDSRLGRTSQYTRVFVSDDGQRVAFSSPPLYPDEGASDPSYSIEVWDRRSARSTLVTGSGTRSLVATPDLSKIVFAEAPRGEQLWVWSENGEAPKWLTGRGPSHTEPLLVDGKLFFQSHTNLWFDDLYDRAPRRMLARNAGGTRVVYAAGSVAFSAPSPDGPAIFWSRL